MKKILAVLSLFSLGLLVSCGGGGSNGGGGGQVHVTVSPTSASVIAGQTQQFSATVTGALNSAVAWSVTCSTTACGTIDAAGLYTAPALIPASLTVTVRATSQEDTNIVGTAAVTHMPVSVVVTPNSSLTLISADTKQFAAAITNAPTGHATYTWSVTGGGSIDANGLYSAPAKVTADATVTVSATSDFDTAKKTSVTVTLKAPVVTLSPGDTTMEAGAQLQFTPTVTYVPTGQNGVTWNLNGLGSVASGMYHAPMLVTTHQAAIIKSTSAFDDTKSAQSVVTMDPIVMSVSPKTITLYPEQTQQFTASVANHVNKAVAWSVTGTSCGGGVCGTINASGLYTAPSSISSQFDVNVVATSIADNSRFDTAVVTLKPITVTVSPKTANVNVSATRQFAATVQGGNNLNVTWSLSGTGCNGATCGTLSASGLYTAPAGVPVPPTVTVTATAVADPSRSDTATVTIINDPNLKLSGPYAFIYTGWDINGKSLDAIGSFVADGNGHITGLIDMNGVNGAYRYINQGFSGSYQVNPSDNRGQLMFTLPNGAWNFRFAIDSTGKKGHLLLFESSGRYGSGVFKRQTTADFSLSSLNGDYAMAMAGMSAMGDERNALAGRMHVDGTGVISATSLYVCNTGGPANFMTFDGSAAMNASTGMSSGRGTIFFSAGGQNPHFSFYLVDSTEAYLIRIDTIGDNTPPYVGGALKQVGGPYTPASFTGNSVFYTTGIVSQTVVKSGVMIGQFTMNGSTGSAVYTYNYGGSIFSGQSSINATVYTNGRVLLNILSNSYVAYLVAPNTGFLLQIDNPGTMVMFGFFEAQTGGPFSDASLSGEFFGGAVAPSTAGVAYGNGIQIYDTNRNWSGIGNTIAPGNGMQPDTQVAGTYIFTDAATGAANWLGTYPGTYNKKFFAISPKKIVFVQTEPSNVQPVVEIFEK